jgi:tetratricopeptide (TPR) repeat protein
MAALPQVTGVDVADAVRRSTITVSTSTRRQELITALRAAAPDDAPTRAPLIRQLAVIERERGRIDLARRLIDDAFEEAASGAGPREIALCRLERVASLAQAGELTEAAAELDRIQPDDLVGQQARLGNQRAVVLLMQDRFDQAQNCFDEALVAAVREHDEVTAASVYANRGVYRAATGLLLDAEADFRSARHAYHSLGQVQRELESAHDLGLVLARQGRIAEALREMISADEEMRVEQILSPDVSADRAEVFIQAGLFREATAAADEARMLALATGAGRVAPEIALLSARAACGSGDLRRAREAAEEAVAGFAALRRDVQLTTARAVVALLSDGPATTLRAVLAEGDRIVCSEVAVAVLRHGTTAAPSLGWQLDHQTDAVISQFLASIADSESAVVQLRAQWARTRLQLAEDDLAGAAIDLDCLLDELDRHARSISSAELVDASVDAVAPIEASVTALALRTNDVCAARGRATRLRSIRSAPLLAGPSYPAGSEIRDEHRRISAQITASEGRADELVPLLRRRNELEERLRTTGFTALRSTPPFALRSSPMGSRTAPVTIGTRIAFVTDSAHLVALVESPGDDRIVELGTMDEIDAALAGLRGALARVLSTEPDDDDHGALQLESLERAASRLEGLVLPMVQRGCVTIEPNATVAGVPWAMLPRLRGTTLRVCTAVEQSRLDAPTITRRLPGGDRSRNTVVIAGPHLPHGRREAELIRAVVNSWVVIDGENATPAAVLRAAQDPTTAVLHLIAHGTVRPDHPLFAAIELHGGVITPEDIELIDRTPGVVVLSSCDLGGSRVLAPSMGFAGRFHARGTAAVVAASLPTSDEHSAEVMADLHQSIATGIDVPTALATAQSQNRSDIARWAARSFTAYVPMNAALHS